MRKITLPVCLLLFALLPVLGACSSGASKGAGAKTAAEPAVDPDRIQVGDARAVEVSKLSAGEKAEIQRAWSQFLAGSPLWRISLYTIVERGGAGPYVLSENLFRHFFQASIYNQKAEINRVARSAAIIGEPAVAYFAKPLVEDLVPLGKAVEANVPDPDDPKRRIKKTFQHFQIDDFTRRHAAKVLIAIGEPAVATLSSPQLLQAARPSGRRYAAFALGRIGSDAAVAALTRHYDQTADWQDRAAAVKALGAAMPSNPAARTTLERALKDKDQFVRDQADRALTGRVKLPL
ncbi:MAG: HEAT repeat domain-containing protein [Planctomycetota bacterium]|nr:HEAT repeat domain-containing protein [Planctomycetota bacterium]